MPALQEDLQLFISQIIDLELQRCGTKNKPRFFLEQDKTGFLYFGVVYSVKFSPVDIRVCESHNFVFR